MIESDFMPDPDRHGYLWDFDVLKIYGDLEREHLKELGMIDVDTAYAHYTASKDYEENRLPKWEVRFCAPGIDDVFVYYFANESGLMCEALMTQVELGNETFVRWFDS
jgi:hypothetical protein